MNSFFSKFLPFIGGPSDMITDWWVTIMLLLFFFSVGYVVYQVRALKRRMRSEEELEQDEVLGVLYGAYKKTFTVIGDQSRTTTPSEEIINDYSLLHLKMNWPLIENGGSLLVGLGILGTFVGLTFGIADSSFNTTEEIKSSINTLLAGMGTAFVTSIWGMLLSLIYTIIQKFQQYRVVKYTQLLNLRLDNDYLLNEGDLSQIRADQHKDLVRSLFDEYLVAEEDGNKQLPKNVFRELLAQSVKQTTSLENLSTDMAQQLEDLLENVLSSNNEKLTELIEDKLVPVLNELKALKEDSGTEMIEQLIGKLNDSMRGMMEEFKQTISGDTKQEMEALTNRLSSVSEALTSVPDSMTDITSQVQDAVMLLTESVKESISLSADNQRVQSGQMNEAMQLLGGAVRDSVRDSAEQQRLQNQQMNDAVGSAAAAFRENIEGLQENMEQLLQGQRGNVEQVSTATDEFRKIIQENSVNQTQLREVMNSMKDSLDRISSASAQLDSSSGKLGSVSDSLQSSVGELDENLRLFLTENRQVIAAQLESVETTQQLLAEHAAQFEIIQSGLKGVFGGLQEGLTEYQTVTADNLNKYLGKFSTAYSDALASTNGLVGQLNEVLEDITDIMGKKSRV